MKERPILFSAPMVRALLDGSKTQTRRVAPVASFDIKQHTDGLVTWRIGFEKAVKGVLASYSGGKLSNDQASRIVASQFNPYGKVGDQLWVRESHWWFKDEHDPVTGYFPPKLTVEDVEFRADGDDGRKVWRPSIHMPRWASRITLEITGVRVERLQDISEADAQAEGARECDPVSGREVLLAGPSQRGSYVLHYRDIWETINGPGSWDLNPWVWAIEFRRLP